MSATFTVHCVIHMWPGIYPLPPSSDVRLGSQGGQWRRALVAYEDMGSSGCRPDSGVYNAVAGTLWNTGVLAAQAKAVSVFQAAVRAGHFRLSVHTSPDAGV